VSALREVVEAAEPALAAYAEPDPGAGAFDGRVADPDRAFVLEAIHEGYLMHYGEPRAYAGMDPDLQLLGGDALYALGLRRLAERGDLPAVAVLSDLITGCARAHAEGRGDLVEELWAEAVSRLA
jgi:hypothetical protein